MSVVTCPLASLLLLLRPGSLEYVRRPGFVIARGIALDVKRRCAGESCRASAPRPFAVESDSGAGKPPHVAVYSDRTGSHLAEARVSPLRGENAGILEQDVEPNRHILVAFSQAPTRAVRSVDLICLATFIELFAMSFKRRPSEFSFFDVPAALWHFLGPERRAFVVFSGILLTVLCYAAVPPYLIGLIANFLIGYVQAEPAVRPPISPIFWLAGLLSGSYAVIALIRLSSKRMLGRISLNARYRAKVWGFERLLDSSLTWHQQESTGNKAQRLLTGAEAVREWTGDVVIDFLNT